MTARTTSPRLVLLIALIGSLVACASGGQQALRSGTLRAGIGQRAVLTEWGWPDRTQSVLSEADLRARWGGVAPDPQVFRERRPLDVWLYEHHGVELVFDGGDLVAWKTDRTPDQLRALVRPGPPTSVSGETVGDGRESLRHGLLRVGIGQKAFRSQWGSADQTVPVGSEQERETRWSPGLGASVLAGRGPLEIWVYEKNGVELLFDDGDLAAWKTPKTVEELRAIPTRR